MKRGYFAIKAVTYISFEDNLFNFIITIIIAIIYYFKPLFETVEITLTINQILMTSS